MLGYLILRYHNHKQHAAPPGFILWGVSLPDGRLQTEDCRLQTADGRLQTADRRPQTADCRLSACTSKGKREGDGMGNIIRRLRGFTQMVRAVATHCQALDADGL